MRLLCLLPDQADRGAGATVPADRRPGSGTGRRGAAGQHRVLGWGNPRSARPVRPGPPGGDRAGALRRDATGMDGGTRSGICDRRASRRAARGGGDPYLDGGTELSTGTAGCAGPPAQPGTDLPRL